MYYISKETNKATHFFFFVRGDVSFANAPKTLVFNKSVLLEITTLLYAHTMFTGR